MAIYHLHAKIISRATGRSAVAAAAYRAASRLHDVRLDRDHDFSNKSGVVHSEILLPDGAPERFLDRSVLWNEVEAIEKRKDAQLAREVEFALPREMTQAQGIALARDFVREQFVERGMVADLNVHWDIGEDGQAKPHAHVMLSTRSVDENGFGAKERSWNDKDLLLTWRERWASLANERLAELDLDVRIDHRSFAAQGIDLEPQNKIGPAGMRREDRGEDAERVADHLEIARRNGEKLLAEPHVALEALTRQQSTFTRQDMARFVDRQTVDAEQFSAVMVRVEACPELVALGKDGHGRERFSTREMIGVEQRLEEASLAMGQSQGHAVPLAVRRAAMQHSDLGDEQALAVGEVTKSRDLSVVVGYAGTGKSTMLGVARAAWEEAGYRVRGAALSGIAAEGLEAGSGIESRTLASLERAWERGFDLLERGDVLVVDEAGMVGSRQMERVLSVAREAGAKVVLVGDPEQLQAIEAGGAFRAVAERVGSVEITTVRRQREGWQQAATKELATGRTEQALGRYEATGLVRGHDTLEEAQAGVVAGWEEARQAAPEESQIMLAHRRVDVRALNEAAREIRRDAGELGEDVLVPTAQGERVFADGERVYFLRNDRELGVKNGTLGTVRGIVGSAEAGDLALLVQLDGKEGTGRGRVVSVSVAEYDALDHGYAATIHKSQGVTVDRAHVLATGSMDRHGAYVALSRHRESVSVHWGRDDVGDRDGLVRRLSRERLKDTTLDYPHVRDRDTGFARRRGLHVPESEIVVGREKAASGSQKDRQAEGVPMPDPAAPAQQKRGMFDGLDLSVRPGRRAAEKDVSTGMEAEAGKGESGGEREARVSPFAGLRLPRVQREQVPARLGGFAPGSGFFRTFRDGYLVLRFRNWEIQKVVHFHGYSPVSRLRSLDLPRSLVVRRVVALDNRVEIEVSLRKRSAVCPDCQCPTRRIHSFYQRKLADLPWQGRPATLIVSVPRFFCQTMLCPRRTFVMPLEGITVRHGRQTTRLADLHYYIAHTLGGSAGARMTVRLCCPISADTLVRRLLSRAQNTTKGMARTRVVGVDDWAWRRGHHYGTIVVDLEKNDVIDLLPDRDADTLARWLQVHPGIEIIARDRAGAYADGCRRGAPSALQVTDRWHLLKNLSDAFVSILDRFTTTVRTLTRQLNVSTAVSKISETIRAHPEEAQAVVRSASGERRDILFKEALALKAAGHSIQAIATTIGVERKTVRRWFQRGHAPPWKRTVPPRSILVPYAAHLEKRWSEGCRNSRQLWRELLEQGFAGQYGTVWKWVVTRQGCSAKPVSSAHVAPPLGRRLARLLLAEDPLSAGQEGLLVPALLEAEPHLAVTLCWLRKMQTLLCKKGDTSTEGDLKALLKEGKTTLLSRLIPALERDAAAIEASLVTPWTTSPVEGQISRLKMIKRTMFGRAGFELLRARVLQPA